MKQRYKNAVFTTHVLDTLWLRLSGNGYNYDVAGAEATLQNGITTLLVRCCRCYPIYARCIYALNNLYDIATLFPRSDSWEVPDEPILKYPEFTAVLFSPIVGGMMVMSYRSAAKFQVY